MTINSHKLHAKFRDDREILRFNSKDPAPEITVFTGTYQAKQYLAKYLKTVEEQTFLNVEWVIADNQSDDGTWEALRAWAQKTNKSVVLVRNVINLGGAGSLYVNLDLVRSDFLTSMHQDDIYQSNFVEEMLRGFKNGPADAVLGFSDMGRVSSTGEKLGAFPAAIWAVPDLSTPTLFLSLLRNHCVPWPAFIVKKTALEQTEPQWYSTAFSDTEATSRMLAYGSFVHISKELMGYRDNPDSESRSIVQADKEIGVAVSLLRIFSSDEFEIVLDSVAEEHRENFVTGLLSALRFRMSESKYYDLVSLFVLEKIDTYWTHSSYNGIVTLGEIYAKAKAVRSAELLGSVAKHIHGESRETPSAPTDAKELIPNQQTKKLSFKARLIHAYAKLGLFVPYSVRKYCWSKALRVYSLINPNNPWNYKWM